MKKLIFACIALLFAITSFAQKEVAKGTITNTTYSYAAYDLGSGGVTGKVAYQLVATRTSGTTTGGLSLWYSNNGTSWTAIPSADTLAITNTASEQSKITVIDIPSAKYVRVRGQLAGTGVYAYKLYANYRYSAKP